MSSANELGLIFVPEIVYNETPVDSALWETARFTSESLSATPTTNTSQEIRNDRMVADQFKVSVEVGGGFDFEFSADTFDSLIDGAMMAAPAAGVWKIGKEDVSYTFEKEYGDLTTNNFILFSGQRVSEWSLGFSHGEAVAGSFSMAGANVTSSSASSVGAGSVIPPTTTRIMNAVSDLSSIEIDTVLFTGCLQSVELNVNNNLRPANCIGKDTPSDQLFGTANITGSISAYLTDTTILWYTQKVINQVEMGIKFTISDGTSSYEFDVPRAKITGNTPNAEGINTDVMITADFEALIDEVSGSSFIITKT